MLSNEFFYSETLADSYVECVSRLKELLRQGKTDECLLALNDLESSMQITLAMDQLHDLKVIN
jgi:hypothetical protein